jgi:hypothetical protein
MRASEDLYRLIKSMTRSEKVYFRNYASRHVIGKKNGYLELFEAIDTQKNYDEKEISSGFAGEKFVSNLAVTKNYLFSMILKSLKDSLHADNADFEIYEQLMFVRLLMDKGLQKRALVLINKVLDQVEQKGQYYLMFKAILNAQSLALSYDVSPQTLKRIESLRKRGLEAQKEVARKSELLYLETRLAATVKLHNDARKKEDEKTIKDILRQPVITQEDETYSGECRYFAARIKLNCESLLGIKDNFIKYSEIMIASAGTPEEMKKNSSNYFSSALSYLDYLSTTKNVKRFTKLLGEFEENLRRYSGTQNIGKGIIDEIELLYNGIMLKHYNNANDDARFLKYLGAAEQILITRRSDYTPRRYLDFCYYTAILLEEKGWLPKALEMNSKIVNYPAHPVKDAIYHYSIILNIMIHYGLGNFELIEYNLKSARRFFRKHERLFETERTLLDFFAKLPAEGKRRQKKEFEELLEKLNILAGKETEKAFFEKINIRWWVRKNIEKLSV